MNYLPLLEYLNNPDIPCMEQSYLALKEIIPTLRDEYRIPLPKLHKLHDILDQLHGNVNDENGYTVTADVLANLGETFLVLIIICDTYVAILEDDADCNYIEVSPFTDKDGKQRLKVKAVICLTK